MAGEDLGRRAQAPVAVEAGLGRMGIHRNVIHPRFGNFVLLGTVVIDARSTAATTARCRSTGAWPSSAERPPRRVAPAGRFRLDIDPGLRIEPQPLLALQPGRDVPARLVPVGS